MTKRMLFCLAHPDDESFGSGAFIAKSVADGAQVSLICATNGDVGSVPADKMNGYSSVAELRLAELQCASKVLGFHEVITLGYRDSGMMGSADNSHPDAFWQADDEEVTQKVIEVMQRLRPQVVVTFNSFGGYGHPDHIKIHRATLAAFERLTGTPGAPQKLYYTALPKAMLRLGVLLVRAFGRDPRQMGTNKDLDFVAVVEAAEPAHARVDVSPFYEIGQQASACHASQSSPRQTFPLAQFLFRRATANTTFTRHFPLPVAGAPLEYDLFEGVTLD